MENNLIKVLDSKKAENLRNLGFEYILDSVNGQPVYAFFNSKELLHHLQSNFDVTDFFFDNMLRF